VSHLPPHMNHAPVEIDVAQLEPDDLARAQMRATSSSCSTDAAREHRCIDLKRLGQ
jgi:hypothetical protein